MLVVLMALVELGKSKVHKATRWFWLLFSGGIGAATLTSCEITSNNGDAVVTTETITPDAIQPDAPVAYGPMQCTDEICKSVHGDGWYCDKTTMVCTPDADVQVKPDASVDVPITPDVP